MRKGWLIPVAAAAAVLLLSGCGLGGDGGAGEDVDASGEVKGKVTFQTWALQPKFTDYVQGVIDAFEAAYPGTEVEWLDQPGDGYSDKVLSQAAGGSLPDVVNLPPDFVLPLVQQGMLLDIEGADDKLNADYVTGGIDAYRYTGHNGVYAYPWYLNTDVNYWNTELLAKYGLDPAKLPTTVDELIAQARTMKKESGGEVYLMSRKPELGDLANAGVPIMAEDGKSFVFNTPEAAAVLDKYRAAFAEGLMPRDVLTDKYAGNAELFNSGTVAWTTGGGNYITSLATDNPTLAPKVIPSPAMGTPPLYAQGLSVASGSKNLPTAMALARWVTNAENQAAFAHLVNIFPSTKASANDPFFAQSDGTPSGDAKVIAFTSLAQARMLQPVEVTGAMSDIVKQQISLAISGDASSQEALDAAVEQCDKLIGQ
ncbi:ABC transporter substrate-binding protein [Phytomonospora endophytica]|uniref:Multiple sugar transport system substrate-binding protein n=1 Tax=Phytomonospora endophytica TaxID=714109 RepID=A0A841FDY7_9ACTN|nr:sugar ABC transporter substrate-binding protein [Phytomonospora endophytica]MBB6034034.1 multiple sugar transport system substrate-binding protein [Phytomonospora endophytica]GIG64445.1 solute-binding protein [Phytomonospora endophytica]